MTDDDAFIRAIVDAPGDDAPRLIYADWLDERGDPRGAYMRAELEWARPWRMSEVPTSQAPVTLGLDPLWLLRVSRPPVGVCCDHLPLSDSNAPALLEWLDEFERYLSLKLPLALRAFLMNRNGGTPIRIGYREKDWEPNEAPTYVGRFYPLLAPITWENRDERDSLANTTKALNNGYVSASTNLEAHRYWTSGRRDFVALANGPNNGLYAIGLTARRLHKIYYVNYLILSAASTKRLVADSLPDFLAMIRYSFDAV